MGRILGIVLGVPPLGGGPSAPSNTIAPAINADPVVGAGHTGDDGTWTPIPDSYTYQWQRNTGTWGDIAGATNKNYTPVDADFGYALRLEVTATKGALSTVAYSNATNLVAEMPARSVGAEVLTNPGSPFGFTGDNPTGWDVVGEIGTDPEVSEVGAGETHGGAGTGYCNLYSSATITSPKIRQDSKLTVGVYYEVTLNINGNVGNKALRCLDAVGGIFADFTGTGEKILIGRAGHARIELYNADTPADHTLTYISAKPLTLNVELIAPSANMRLDHFYTLPASPLQRSQTWLCPRISAWATGNYWAAKLVYTGTQWNIDLYSVATHTATSRISATNIGATNGVRVNMNGDQISLWTTANGGTNWTQRGSTITNSTYQTATGVNALWTGDFTPGNFVYAAAS